MKRFLAMVISLLVLAAGNTISASGEIPQRAQDFADNHFYNIVVEQLESEHAGNFNLKPDSKNITFGPLHATYTLSEEFVKSKKPDLLKGIVQADEFIAVVYQDGKPVNVIGTYETDAGTYALSNFGHGLDLAKKINAYKGSDKLVYEFPQDAWYLYNGKRIRPLNDAAKVLMSDEKDLADYQKDVYGRYKNAGQQDGDLFGGDSGTSSDKHSLLYSVIAALVVACGALIVYNRKLKKQL